MRNSNKWGYLVVGWFAASSAIVLASERHHALIVGVGQYSQASGADPLKGVPKDMMTSRNMALAMGVPDRQIIELRDKQATKANILEALDNLNKKVGPGRKSSSTFLATERVTAQKMVVSRGSFLIPKVLTHKTISSVRTSLQATHPRSAKRPIKPLSWWMPVSLAAWLHRVPAPFLR